MIQYPNDFMMRSGVSIKEILDKAGIESKIILEEEKHEEKTDFIDDFNLYKKENYDAYVFLGYKSFGYAMKQARDIGITAPFFGATTMLDPAYYDNSEGALIGTEFPFFTPKDGNYVLAQNFLINYENKFNEQLFSVWPAMQAYDVVGMTLNEVRTVNKTKKEDVEFGDWLREALLTINHYQGVCGNIMITEDGTSKGIYFSLYQYNSKGKITLVNR